MSVSKDSERLLTPTQNEQFSAIYDEVSQLVEQDEVEQAFAVLNEALEALSEDAEYARLNGALLAFRADLNLDEDESDAALSDAREALNLGWETAHTRGIAGWSCFGLEKFEQAREYFEAALQGASDDVALLNGHALALIELDEFERAQAELTYAIHLDPSKASLYASRSEVHLRLGDFDAAERDIRRARELDPEENDYVLDLARVLMLKGNLQSAVGVVDKLVDDPELSLETLLLRSHLRLLIGRNQDARDDAIRASNRFSHEAFAFVQLAHVQLAEGNVALANKAAERAVKLDPSLPDGYMVRGAALQLKGELESAREDFQRASQAPVELPMFLLGSAYECIEHQGFDSSIMDMFEKFMGDDVTQDQINESFAQGQEAAAAGGFAGFNPMEMLGQVFDESGNIRGPFRSVFDMALKNAPKLMKNLPPEVLANMGGIDPSKLDEINMDELSSEQIEAQMREFYKKMQSGDNPFAGMPNPFAPKPPTNDDE